jgi:hypothetical protein
MKTMISIILALLLATLFGLFGNYLRTFVPGTLVAVDLCIIQSPGFVMIVGNGSWLLLTLIAMLIGRRYKLGLESERLKWCEDISLMTGVFVFILMIPVIFGCIYHVLNWDIVIFGLIPLAMILFSLYLFAWSFNGEKIAREDIEQAGGVWVKQRRNKRKIIWLPVDFDVNDCVSVHKAGLGIVYIGKFVNVETFCANVLDGLRKKKSDYSKMPLSISVRD